MQVIPAKRNRSRLHPYQGSAAAPEDKGLPLAGDGSRAAAELSLLQANSIVKPQGGKPWTPFKESRMPVSTTAPSVARLPDHVTCQDIATSLQVIPGTIRNWVRNQRFPPPLRIGRRWFWPTDVVLAFLDQRQ